MSAGELLPPGPFVLDTSHTRYHVVRAGAALAGWRFDDRSADEDARLAVPETLYDVSLRGAAVADDCLVAKGAEAVLWADKSITRARVTSLPCYQRINHFIGMNVIARKAVLFKRLMRVRALCLGSKKSSKGGQEEEEERSEFESLLEALDFAPRSFVTGSDMALLHKYVDEQGEKRGFFILKPNKGCQGRGILLTDDPVRELERCCGGAASAEEYLVQTYVDNPLLIEGKKFDLRLYALLVSVADPPADSADSLGGVRLFVFDEGLVRLCARDYAPVSSRNAGERSVHLTNYAVNKRSADYRIADEPEGTAGLAEGSKRDLRFLAQYVDSLPQSGGWGRVRRRVDECLVLTVLSGVETLRREQQGAGGTRGHKADARGCFELLGFDVMLTSDCRPVLMEVNHSPSLFCESRFDYRVKSALVRDTLRVLETHLPPPGAHRGQPRRYAEFMAAERESMRRRESALARSGAVGFTELLPSYSRGDGDWSPEERLRQTQMAQLSSALR